MLEKFSKTAYIYWDENYYFKQNATSHLLDHGSQIRRLKTSALN